MKTNIIGEHHPKMDKDDSFWFSSKMEDWIGLTVRVLRKGKSGGGRYRSAPAHIKGNRIVLHAYSSLDAALYLGISPGRFRARFKDLGVEFDYNDQAKKYSHETIEKVARLIEAEKIAVPTLSRMFTVEEIRDKWDVPLEHLHIKIKKKRVSYETARNIARKYKKQNK